MDCGDFIEIFLSKKEKIIYEQDSNICFFINVCYLSNTSSEYSNPYTCERENIKFATIPYHDNFLKLFPSEYKKSDLIGKIYSFEIELIKKTENKNSPFTRFFSRTTTNEQPLTITCYFIFSDGNHTDKYFEYFNCFKKSKNIENEILDLTNDNLKKIFITKCNQLNSKHNIKVKKIIYFFKKNRF